MKVSALIEQVLKCLAAEYPVQCERGYQALRFRVCEADVIEYGRSLINQGDSPLHVPRTRSRAPLQPHRGSMVPRGYPL